MDGMMQQIQKDRAPAQRMDMLDILQNYVEQQGGDFDKVYDALKEGMDAGAVRIMRYGNTLMIYKIMQPGVADVEIASADSAQDLVAAIKDFYQAMQKANFKSVTMSTENPQIGRAVQASGVPVQVSMRPSTDGTQEFDLIANLGGS